MIEESTPPVSQNNNAERNLPEGWRERILSKEDLIERVGLEADSAQGLGECHLWNEKNIEDKLRQRGVSNEKIEEVLEKIRNYRKEKKLGLYPEDDQTGKLREILGDQYESFKGQDLADLEVISQLDPEKQSKVNFFIFGKISEDFKTKNLQGRQEQQSEIPEGSTQSNYSESFPDGLAGTSTRSNFPNFRSRIQERLASLPTRRRVADMVQNYINTAREGISHLFSDAAQEIREKRGQINYLHQKKLIETGQDLREFLAEIRERLKSNNYIQQARQIASHLFSETRERIQETGEGLKERFQLGELKEGTKNEIQQVRENAFRLFSETSKKIQERIKIPKEARGSSKRIKTGQDLREFLAEIRGKQIERAAKGGVLGLPPSLAIGVASGLARHELLEIGLEAAGAAPIVAAAASLARDTIRVFTSDGNVIPTLAARYVRERPTPKTQSGREKLLTGLSKIGWWTQIVERAAVKKITEKGLEEGSTPAEILKFIDSKCGEKLQNNENLTNLLANPKELRKILTNFFFKEKKVRDRTSQLIKVLGFLTDAKTLNNYRDIEGLQNLTGSSPVENLEKLRKSLYDILLVNLRGIKNLNQTKFNEYIDQLSQYKWGVGRKAKYAAAIMGVGAGMAAIKAFAGVKAVDLIVEVSEIVEKSGISERVSEGAEYIWQKSGTALETIGKNVGKGIGEITKQTQEAVTRGVEEYEKLSSRYQLPTLEEVKKTGKKVQEEVVSTVGRIRRHIEDLVRGQTGERSTLPIDTEEGKRKFLTQIHASQVTKSPPQSTGEIPQTTDIFEGVGGETIWDKGAKVGETLARKINMSGLKESWMHGETQVTRSGAFRNFFGHWAREGGPLDPNKAVKIAEGLRDALLLDQKDYMVMARLLRNLKDAATPEELKEILNSMDRNSALNVVFYAFAEGLIQDSELRKFIIDFIKENSQ